MGRKKRKSQHASKKNRNKRQKHSYERHWIMDHCVITENSWEADITVTITRADLEDTFRVDPAVSLGAASSPPKHLNVPAAVETRPETEASAETKPVDTVNSSQISNETAGTAAAVDSPAGPGALEDRGETTRTITAESPPLDGSGNGKTSTVQKESHNTIPPNTESCGTKVAARETSSRDKTVQAAVGAEVHGDGSSSYAEDIPASPSSTKKTEKTTTKDTDNAGASQPETKIARDDPGLHKTEVQESDQAASQDRTDTLPASPKRQEESTTASPVPRKRINVRFASSAFLPHANLFREHGADLPNGDCGDGITNPFDKNIVQDKYWAQRRRFFTRFDQGIQLDKEGWFSVTPEAIAKHTAERVVQLSPKTKNLIVLDAFCGCGGNAIAFAARPEIDIVVAVDSDASKLRKAANNARVYDIPTDKIVFIHADSCALLGGFPKRCKEACNPNPQVENCHGYRLGSLDLLPQLLDAIFLSPPWGGSDYERKHGRRGFDLSKIHVQGDNVEVDGQGLLELASTALASKKKVVAYFLPRNINGLKIATSALEVGYSGILELEQNLLNGKLKTVTAFLGGSLNAE